MNPPPGPVATAHDERPLYLMAGDTALFGVLTATTGDGTGVGVLTLSGGVYVLSTNRNRLFVRLARILAGFGHRVLRIDFRGVGDSGGVIGPYSLREPNAADVTAAAGCLAASRVDRIVVVGSCFGARAAMHALAEHAMLSSMVLFSPPLGDGRDGEAPTADDIGPLFRSRVETLWRRRIPTLFLYGLDDPHHRDFQVARAGCLAHLFAADSPFAVRTVSGHAHTLQQVSTQDELIAQVVDWCADLGGRE